MRITKKSIDILSNKICGDNGPIPYKTGKQLVNFFNNIENLDVYDENFPKRSEYVRQKLLKYNGTKELCLIIELSLDPRDFLNVLFGVEDAVNDLNHLLEFDGYKIVKKGRFYKVIEIDGFFVCSKNISSLSQRFIEEQISKCKNKIEQGDFDGAITNSRTLVEAILIEIIEKDNHNFKSNGKLEDLYKKVKKKLNLKLDKSDFPETVIQILSGLNSILCGISGLSNNFGDRHANKFKTKKHHAMLAVNVSLTFSNFIIDTYTYQKNK